MIMHCTYLQLLRQCQLSFSCVCGGSMKFGSKLMYLDYLHELAQHIPLNQLIIPPAIRKSVSMLPTSALLLKR